MSTPSKTYQDLMSPQFKNIYQSNNQIRLEQVRTSLKSVVLDDATTKDMMVELMKHLGLINPDNLDPASPTPFHVLLNRTVELGCLPVHFGGRPESGQNYLQRLPKIDEYLTNHPKIINEQWESGLTALHEAVSYGLIRLATILLKHHPDLSLVNSDGQTAEQYARSINAIEIADLIANSN